MEISIAEKGETSRANDQKPISEFTQKKLDIIDEQVTKYLEEAKKLKEKAHRRNASYIYRVLSRLKDIHQWKLVIRVQHDQLEEEIRKCYSEEFDVDGIAFLEMMVVDACFIKEIIEMFAFTLKGVHSSESDLEALAWMVLYFYRDFLLLVNQIHFLVLEEIYALTLENSVEVKSRSRLVRAALGFFKNGMKKSGFTIIFGFIHGNLDQMDTVVLHLLDLVRSSLIPASNIQQRQAGFLVYAPFM
ncbi:hypothetical protein F2P56_036418 [Juglans regia]|uniref:Uncharacterized protein n=1 Tax=Juglans regia TaxID=51240 RepID=A0A833SL76_JUGRE|nr:hypothetical protein F2P56_036418 [Juglans regia]